MFAGQQPPTGGIYKAMEPLLCKHDKGNAMKQWLKLQREALTGNADTQNKFWGDLLRQSDMVVMGVIAEGSQEVLLLHSCAMFGGLFSGPELKGKEFGWLGDSDEYGGQPSAVKLPDKIHTSTKVKYRNSVAEFATFYGQDGNRGEVWKPTSSPQNPLYEGDMFCFVLLVGDLAAYAADSPRTPAEIRRYAEALVADDTNELEAADLRLVLDWCLMACQRKPSTNNSLLSLNFRPAAQRDKTFAKWKRDVLMRTMGGRPNNRPLRQQH